MATSSNDPDALGRLPDYKYLYVSNTNVSNFVSVKLCGARNYQIWKTQMICLMEAHDMLGLVEEGSIDSSTKDMAKYDSLLKGWIFGSVSEDVLRIVVDSESSATAKDVWNTLKRYFNATKSSDDQQDSASIEVDKKIERKAENGKTESKSSLPKDVADDLQKAIQNDDWDEVFLLIIRHRDIAIKEQINSDGDGSTALHIAVGIGRNDVLRRVLRHTDDDLTVIKNYDESTFLHIAAIVGNTDAAELLVRKDPNLLVTFDKDEKTPLDKAVENMQLHTIAYLLEAIEQEEKKKKDAEDQKRKKAGKKKAKGASDEDGKTLESVPGGHVKSKEAADDDRKGKEEPDDDGTGKEGPDDDDDEKRNEEPDVDRKGKEASKDSDDSHLPHVEIGANVLVNAISAREYEFALKLVSRNSKYAVRNDEVLMAIARTFPSGLDDLETLFYPDLDNLCETMVNRSKDLFNLLVDLYDLLKKIMSSILSCEYVVEAGVVLILVVPAAMVNWIFLLILLLLWIVYFPFFMLYFLFWNVAMRVVPPIRNIEKKKKEYDEAKCVLDIVCKNIKETNADGHESFYTGPILDAACQNAYEVVVEILKNWPKAIRCKDENGYDIIQLATIHRSEKIYNLIYKLVDHKNNYRTMIDSSKNNMLHLAGRLAPSNKLKLRTGAALQLQRELQWREEVKKLVFPSYATKENIFKETPDMVFTKEHENLVKEGEKWIKTVAESCSITAALITTIVFAAAITVPGGSSQEGVPVFMKELAFTIFAIADAISLFSSATALLVFLSILTARFAEQDFLVSLPRRMIIGLWTLLLSTTSMMVAFGATLFLVFCHDKLWMLAPLCGLAFFPIAIFFILQFPLILDLFRSTYISKFGKSNHNNIKFNLNVIQLFLGKLH